MLQNKLNYKLINLTALVLLLYLLISSISIWGGIVIRILKAFTPFIVGFAFAYAFTPLVRWLMSKGIKKGISVIIVLLLIILVLGSIMILTLPLIYEQLSLLIKMVVEVINNLDTKYNINLGGFEFEITSYLNDILKEIGTMASSTGLGIINGTLGFTGNFIVGFVGFIYFLLDMDKIRELIKKCLKTVNSRAFEYVKLMDTEISNYMKGLEIFMVIQFFEYSFLFFITGHPNWLILGILACVTTIIPYFGGLITNLIAILLASVVSTRLLILTIIICLIFPQLDGYIISPKVYGKTNNVNPLITIMVVSVGGSLYGFLGIIIALPVYLLLRTTINFFKSDLKKGMVIVKKTI